MLRKRFYPLTRDLHLYFGLFISPFVLVFAVSVFYLVHSRVAGASARPRTTTVSGLRLPAALEALDGRERVDAIRSVLVQLKVGGEIGFIQHFPGEHRLVIPVAIPGRETVITLNCRSATAEIASRDTGTAAALVYLHKSPGPHLAAIRGNWPPTVIWRWFADLTVYLLLFVSISGIYLWAVMRAERPAGLILLSAGAISFFGIVYGLCR